MNERQPLLETHQHDVEQYNRLEYGTRDVPIYEPNSHLLTDTLYPPDAFAGKCYWADLNSGERKTFARQQYRSEIMKEWKAVSKMFMRNPINPLTAYVQNYVAAGAGFFAEGSVLFSVGNTMPLLNALWPECWAKHFVCDARMIDAVKYMEILGIIFGQFTVGLLGDKLGKRWGLIQDAAVMLLGTILLTSMWGATLNGWTVMYGVSLFVFAYGVGGEYPMASTTSMEKYRGREDRLHRGRNVLLAFLMQGWGQLVNQLVLIVTLLLFNQSMNSPYNELATQLTFRLSFAITGATLVYLVYYRVKLREINSKPRTKSFTSLRQVFRHYWPRILGTSICWFCSDFPFYGNQVFRNDLLKLVTGTSSGEVRILWLYNLINIGCELTGYYLAALLIDHKSYGRRRMQLVGFTMMFLLFGTVASSFESLNQKGAGAKIFQAIYFFSNFWIQFGPNSTTFLVAGEVYPKDVRATLHGFSAAIGKIGALAATVLYNYMEDRTKFILMALCTLIGLMVTLIFVPDTTGLDLAERERYWQLVVQGKAHEYHGTAIHPEHLSWYERAIMRRADNYKVELDRAAKVSELRKQFRQAQEDGNWQIAVKDGEHYFDADVVKYFETEDKMKDCRK